MRHVCSRLLAPTGVIATTLSLVFAAQAQVYPDAEWETRKPREVGLDTSKLEAFSAFLGGQGCIVRHGYMVYTWGDQQKRTDVASACKPVYSHFLFKAVEENKLPSTDELVVKYQPCLKEINACLGHKDARISFRHLVNQISGYGVREDPGTAFDYNDYNMTLFFDTLMLKVYGCADWQKVDDEVLRPKLTDPLQCQDHPTLTAFGAGNRAGRLGISVRDFARLGLLYLRQGNWKGRQLISREHVVMAVTSPIPNSIPRTRAQQAEMCPGQRSVGSQRIPDDQCDHNGCYSFAWWINGVGRNGQRGWPDAPTDTYGAFGHCQGLRAMVVIPSLAIVVSWNDTNLCNYSGNPQNEALRRLVAAVVAQQPPVAVISANPLSGRPP